MEFSDSDEEIIDLNKDKKKSKENQNKETEKTKSKTSSSTKDMKDMKWVKSSLECISQIARSEIEENEQSENLQNQNEEENENQNKDNTSDKNNKKENKDFNNDDNFDNDFLEPNDEIFPDTNSSKKEILYTFIWDEGGNEVKLIGSFSNWKEQFLMVKDKKSNIYKCALPLNNDKYQYKFIVDGVWKYSKKQSTIDDGKGNINNILDLTNPKTKEDTKKKGLSKKKEKNQKRKSKIKEKKKSQNLNGNDNADNVNSNKPKKKEKKNREYGNEYPDPIQLTEPSHSEIIAKSFNINNESKQHKIGIQKYYKFTQNISYSSMKSYLNLSHYRHTILNHILFQKVIKEKSKVKIGISYRFREKATTLIYFN
jgi:hypothetical protein